MRKYLLYPSLFILLVLLGCTNENNYTNTENDDTLLLQLSLPQPTTVEVGTRSAGSADENHINDMLVIVTKNMIGSTQAQYFDVDEIIGNDTATPSVKLQLKKVRPGAGEKIIVLCNTRLTEQEAKSIKNEDELQKLLGINRVSTKSASELAYSPLPMHGSMIFGVEGTLGVGGSPISVRRSHACVSIKNSLSESTFKWSRVSINNVRGSGYVISYQKDEPLVPADNTNNNGQDVISSQNPENLYIGEVSKDDNVDTPNIMLQADYNGPNGTKNGWYKIDLIDKVTKERFHILRNHKYLINITKVSSYGYATENEASTAPASNLEYEITDTDLAFNNIMSNGQYAIATNIDEIAIIPSEAVATNTFQVKTIVPSGVNLGIMSSNLTNNIKIYDENNVDVTSDSSSPLKVVGTPKLSITGGTTEVNFITSGARFDGYQVEVNFGNLSKRIPVEVNSANCYLLPTNSVEVIPLSQANKDGVERIKLGVDEVVPEVLWADFNPMKTLILSYDKDRAWIKVSPVTTFSGNIVIAAKVNGVIKWSWHLWVTNYKPETSYEQPEELTQGFKWMDRNLGALNSKVTDVATQLGAFGLYYQWGRKDPFVSIKEYTGYSPGLKTRYRVDGNAYPLGVTAVKETGTNNLERSIREPMTILYTNSGNWYNSIKENSNIDLWDNNGSKTAYDPCPIGWKVPPEINYNSPWKGLTLYNMVWTEDYQGGNNGMGFTIGSAYYPRAGEYYLGSNATEVTKISSNSFCYQWSATTSSSTLNGIQSYGLGIYRNGMNNPGVFDRQESLPVRCIKEE